MPQTIRCQRVGWNTVFTLTYQLALQIRLSGYRPDLVVAIARGGYIPARLLCDYLDIYDLCSLRIEHYTAGATKSKQARLTMPTGVDLEQRSILLVDDVDDSGDTIALALHHLTNMRPEQTRVAVLHHKSCSSQVPDYFAEEQTEWRWLTYPWAMTEDVKGFVARLEPVPGSLTEIQQRLQQEFDLSVSLETLQNIYRLEAEASNSVRPV